MKPQEFPVTVVAEGVQAKIYQATQKKNGTSYTGYLVTYSLLGKRRQVWRAAFEDAETAAKDACKKIARGEHVALTLTGQQQMEYLRAADALKAVDTKIDVACTQYAEAVSILNGRATLADVARDWMKRNAVTLPSITVKFAADEFEEQLETDKRAAHWIRQVASILKRFSKDFNVEVATVTPDLISRWLTGLSLSERSRRNYRDVLGYFNRFLIRRGYLAKDDDWLNGVQNYSARKIGEVEIYSPEQLKKLLESADKREFKEKLIPFICIGAFAGLRSSEISRLNWENVELSDVDGESFIEVVPTVGTKSDGRRRLVPVADNLRAWLRKYRKAAGPVCNYANVSKRLLKIADGAELEWSRNALRHSAISYRVAESGDIARIADQSGNSVAVVKSNYLRRCKPQVAQQWFGIMPE